MLKQILPELAPILATVITAALTWAAARLVVYIKAKTQATWLQGLLIRATDAVAVAVKAVVQTYSEAIKAAKADGKLTPEEAAQAKALGLAKAKELIGPAGIAQLVKILGLDSGALDAWLGTRIEAAVHDTKAPVAAETGP